jgi:hypothetical protein
LVVAGVTVGNSATYAEALGEPALVAGDSTAAETAPAVELKAIRADAAAVATISRTVYGEAGRTLDRLVRSGFPDDQVRVEAVSALRQVAKLSYHLVTASQVLADAADAASAGQLPKPELLAQAREEFDLTAKAFDRSAHDLLRQIRVVHAHEESRKSLSDEIARREADAVKAKPDRGTISRLHALEQEAIAAERAALKALIRLASPYEAAQDAVLAVVSQLITRLAPPLTRETPEPGISLSVYGLFDRQGAAEGYGLYTYVLLAQAPGVSRRNASFLRELFATTQRTATELEAVRRQLNIFYVPIRNRIQALVTARISADAAAAIAAPGMYDYEHSERLLFRLCTESASSDPKLCASAWRGPYLLTVPEPVSASAALSSARLLLDLSDVHERAFGEFIRALKEQVMRADFTDRQKIDTVRLGLLDITLKAADWLHPVKEGIAEIVLYQNNAPQ